VGPQRTNCVGKPTSSDLVTCDPKICIKRVHIDQWAISFLTGTTTSQTTFSFSKRFKSNRFVRSVFQKPAGKMRSLLLKAALLLSLVSMISGDSVPRPDCNAWTGANCVGTGQICCGAVNGPQYLFCNQLTNTLSLGQCTGSRTCVQRRTNCIINDGCARAEVYP